MKFANGLVFILLLHFQQVLTNTYEKIDITNSQMAVTHDGWIKSYGFSKPNEHQVNANIFIMKCMKRQILYFNNNTNARQITCENEKSTQLQVFYKVKLEYDSYTNTFSSEPISRLRVFNSELQCTDKTKKVISKNVDQTKTNHNIKLQGLIVGQFYSCKLTFTNVTTNEIVGYSHLLIVNASIPFPPTTTNVTLANEKGISQEFKRKIPTKEPPCISVGRETILTRLYNWLYNWFNKI